MTLLKYIDAMINSTSQDIKSNKQKELTKVFDKPKKKIKWERKLADVVDLRLRTYIRKKTFNFILS